MSSTIVYRAGSPVCVSVEQQFAAALAATRHQVEAVHLAELK